MLIEPITPIASQPEGMMKMQTTTALAADLNTNPRTLRKFLRSDASGVEAVGKGSRYALPTAKREVAALKKKFDAWGAAQAEAKAKRDAEVEVEVETPEVEDEVHPLDA